VGAGQDAPKEGYRSLARLEGVERMEGGRELLWTPQGHRSPAGLGATPKLLTQAEGSHSSMIPSVHRLWGRGRRYVALGPRRSRFLFLGSKLAGELMR